MKNCPICCSFLGFAFGTPPRERFFSCTRIGIAALFTNKTIRPLYPCQKFEALIIVPEHFLKLFFTEVAIEYLTHDSFQFDANVNKFSVTKMI
jgi:hypothetical protein